MKANWKDWPIMIAVILLAALGLALSRPVNSAELEIGLGATHWDAKELHGYYAQQGLLPYTWTEVTPGFSLGLRFNDLFTNDLDLSVGYKHLGKVESQAEATTDMNYFAIMTGEQQLDTDAIGTFQTSGYVHGAYGVFSYPIAGKISGHIGGWLHTAREKWSAHWYHCKKCPRSQEGTNQDTWEISPIYGVSWDFDETTSLSLMVTKIKAYGPAQPIYNGRSPVSLTLVKRF